MCPDDPAEEPLASLFMSAAHARTKGDSEAVYEYTLRALNRARQMGNQRAEALAYLNLAENALHYCCFAGDPLVRRRRLCLLALPILEKCEDMSGVARALRLLASTSVGSRRSIRFLRRSISIARAHGLQSDEIKSLTDLALHHALRGRTTDAVRTAKRAIQLGKCAGDARALAHAFVVGALVQSSDEEERLRYFERGIAIYRRIGDLLKLAEALQQAAMLIDNPQYESRMVEYLREARVCYQKLSMHERAKALDMELAGEKGATGNAGPETAG